MTKKPRKEDHEQFYSDEELGPISKDLTRKIIPLYTLWKTKPSECSKNSKAVVTASVTKKERYYARMYYTGSPGKPTQAVGDSAMSALRALLVLLHAKVSLKSPPDPNVIYPAHTLGHKFAQIAGQIEAMYTEIHSLTTGAAEVKLHARYRAFVHRNVFSVKGPREEVEGTTPHLAILGLRELLANQMLNKISRLNSVLTWRNEG